MQHPAPSVPDQIDSILLDDLRRYRARIEAAQRLIARDPTAADELAHHIAAWQTHAADLELVLDLAAAPTPAAA